MPIEVAKYACDECHSRKIRCSREVKGCVQCKADERNCVYSRAGIIRRRAKQLKRSPASTASRGKHASPDRSEPQAAAAGELQSQMQYDITTTQENLRQYADSEDDATGTLSNLGAEYSSFWHGPNMRDMALELGVGDKTFLAFDQDQISLFTQTFVDLQSKGRPLFMEIPPEILREIALHPGRVQEKAHLVMVYGILLTEACLSSSYDKMTITKLRWNLRLALDDAKLLLEPSDLNVQALFLLACHVQEFSTPSLCWMAISSACRMLQVLGVNTKNLNPETKERRLVQFWTLNAIDKHLALVFGRPPNMHKTMSANTPLIPMQKLLDWQSHISTEEKSKTEPFRSMFGAHIVHTMHLSSIVLSDVWSCLFEDASTFNVTKRKLDDWCSQALSILQACLLAEKPFLDTAAQRSMELGIQNIQFNYYYLKVLLLRSRIALKDECISASQEALLLLKGLVSDSNEVYNGIIWVLLFSPFTPFFFLFGEILSTGNTESNHRSLDAMEMMSSFMDQMKSRHPQAAKLHIVATTFVKYARAALAKPVRKIAESNGQTQRDGKPQVPAHPDAGSAFGAGVGETIALQDSEMQTLDGQSSQQLYDLFNDPSLQNLSVDMDSWLQSSQFMDAFGPQTNGMEGVQSANASANDTYGFFADSTFDWLSWNPNTADQSSQRI